jgi:predicted ATPase/DNA-binding winged helix-turn-helix (wHTH) protein
MITATGEAKDRLSFGPFNLVASERLLTTKGSAVELGSRALDILLALISKPNEIVSKKELMSRVWPDVIVEEGSLRFHIAGLRKALGDGQGGARYITTIAGRGYCFVAPISLDSDAVDTGAVAVDFPHANLPGRLSRMVGRDEDVLKLSTRLGASRLITIVGAGGVGKTTVAIAAAHHLEAAFAGSVLFVDLGMLSDPRLVAAAVASMLGVSVRSEDATPSLIAFLKSKRILLVLDTCEHLVEVVAAMVADIMKAAPHVHILATSREALRIEGEHVYRLDALACPPDTAVLTAANVHSFPATQLFVERVVANGAQLELSDTDAAIVAGICRKLDGVALAIELAARRVESYGLQQTAALLDQHLTLLWQGSRTAPPRQKTLHAALDWSYELLSAIERIVLRRLAVFVGHFTLDAALDVVAGAPLDRTIVFGAIDSLVEKSMVAARPIGAMMRYRLLDTTRSYALELDADDTELTDLNLRHATYYRRWLEQAATEWASLSTGAERAPHFAALNNVRAALEWCFSDKGDVGVGVELAAMAAPVFLAIPLLPECHRWSERALQALDESHRGGREEMQLQTSLGLSLMYSRGHSDAALAALNRSLDVAGSRGDHSNEVRLLGPLHFYHLRGGEFRVCLQYAERAREIANTLADPAATALAQTLLGISLHFMGDLGGARLELEAALRAGRASPANRKAYFGFDHYSWAGNALIRNLWLQGYPAQAKASIDQAFEEAVRVKHPMSLAVVVNTISVLLWMGDLGAAEEHLDWFISRAESEYFGPYLHLGHAFKAELAIRRGDFKAGMEMLHSRLEKLHAMRYELLTARFNVVLVSAFAEGGRVEEALNLVEETARLIETKGYISYVPELLRVKGGILLTMPGPRVDLAETCLTQSLEVSRAQGARAWELRTATDLASLWASKGRASPD